jgi:hypothetical protein
MGDCSTFASSTTIWQILEVGTSEGDTYKKGLKERKERSKR